MASSCDISTFCSRPELMGITADIGFSFLSLDRMFLRISFFGIGSRLAWGAMPLTSFH